LGDALIELSDFAPSFLFLCEQGFAKESGSYLAGRTDSGHLIMSSQKFSMKFTLDRNQVFVDIGSENIGWEKLELALMYVDKSILEKELGAPPKLDLLADLLRANWNEITSIYNNRSKVGKLRNFCKAKSRSFNSGLFPKS